MSESTPPHGSSLLDQVDLTADVQPEGPLSAPAAKKARLSLQQPSSSGSSATGRPQGTLWGFYTRSSQKQNKSHYSASCDPCSFAGTNARVLGTADSMRSHLLKCPNVPDAVHEWAKKWTPKSEPYVADAADSGAATTPACCESSGVRADKARQGLQAAGLLVPALCASRRRQGQEGHAARARDKVQSL